MLTWDSMPDSWNEVAPGTEISEKIFDDMLNAMPPIPLCKSPYCGFQLGEANDHKEDTNGKWRARYLTFVGVGGKYYYAGVHFGGECDWRMEQ